VAERLLWTWCLAVFAFFSVSHFKLDHYVYPLAPALCLLAARAWHQLRDASAVRPHTGAAIGTALGAVTLVAGGIALIPKIRTLPLTMLPWADLVPAGFIAAGLALLGRLALARFRPPRIPYAVAASWLVAYAVILVVVLPEFERAKPVKDLAQWMAKHAPGRVGAYQLDRWNTSFRFYVERPVEFFETPEALVAFAQQPGNQVLMMRTEFDTLRAAGHPLSVVFEREGLFTTTGRAIQREGRSNWKSFVVVVGGRAGASMTLEGMGQGQD
jgi:4-amino-4-deoxy-L-arabinose transferase-like glycosyltransferase